MKAIQPKALMNWLVLCLFFTASIYANELKPIELPIGSIDEVGLVVEDLYEEVFSLHQLHVIKVDHIENQIKDINASFLSEQTNEQKLDLLIKKDRLRDELELMHFDHTMNISKVRYVKGLQIIKILYEKVLSLDHHFASVRTFNEISKMSNPNQYPEFEKVKNLVKDNRDRRQGFDLSALLNANAITSVISTFSNMMISSISKEEKENELAKVECILDFTLRMNNDLNTIFFETSYLQSSTDGIKADIEQLFRDYTKHLKYLVPLPECRQNDDWDVLGNKLEEYLTQMNNAEGTQKTRMLIDLEFPIDRLLQFVTQYNNFINEGERFYQKFEIILNSYENEEQCSSKLPSEYTRLKSDIALAIEKFNIAYRPVEINGSKMKEILYGINEYN